LAPLTTHNALSTWQFAPLVSAVLIAAAAAYLAAAWTISRRSIPRPWPRGRTAAFLLGLAVIAVATQSSIGVYDDVLFSVHMVQHLLLIMVAPPLLVGGRPVTLVLRAARNPLRARVRRIVRSPTLTALTWPPAAAMLYAAVVVATHLTPLMNLVLENGAAHDAEHAVYVAVGYLYFLPVVGSEPISWRMSAFGRYLLLLATMPVDTAVGVVLTLAPHELFSAYTRTRRTWGPGLVADLHDGGLIMFIGSDLIMTVLALALAARFVRGRDGYRVSARPAGQAEVPRDLGAYNAYLAALGTAPTGDDFHADGGAERDHGEHRDPHAEWQA
jgi:putative copper resistance protein D